MQANCATTSPWPAPSPITIFLRNVHLLQLDQYQDWPGLSRKLFSGDQKLQTQRVKSVEWVLYHLFLLWDPAETKNKLRPFFPPLEPLQSVNLRAALFRALSELKKNGNLRRDTIVRKTMLDDCKGSKFEEVLAVFSTVVLRKVVSENLQEPGIRLASAKNLTESELEEKLVPLIIAHHSALSATKRNQVKIRENYDQFSTLLDEKTKDLSVRSSTKLQPVEDLPRTDDLVNNIKVNWLGSQILLDTLLNSGGNLEKDAFLELPFEKAWRLARKENINQFGGSSPHVNLLQDLETCHLQQRTRLQRLGNIKKSMNQIKRESGANMMIKSHDEGQSLAFREHQALTVAGIQKSLQGMVEPQNLFDEHQAVVSSLKNALAEIKGIQVQQTEHSINKISSSLEPPQDMQHPKNILTLSPIPDTEHLSLSPSPSIIVDEFEEEHHVPVVSLNVENAPIQQPSDTDSKPDISIKDLEDSNPLPKADSSEFELPSDPEDTSAPPLPQIESRPSSLLERTRKSMSLLPPPSNSRSRQSLAARRETRQSQIFPINQFDTPPKESLESARSGASTPRDELFSEEAEYASIFKSRPRVVHSPLMSPAVHVGFIDDAEEYVEDSESFLDLVVDGSPLANKKR